MNALKLNQVSVKIRDRIIIKDLSLIIEEGNIGCLLGPSGCGKTTLLRAIAGFEHAIKGEIWLHDRCVSKAGYNLPAEKRQVGMVFQDYALFPHLTVKENIAFGLEKLNAKKFESRLEEVAE